MFKKSLFFFHSCWLNLFLGDLDLSIPTPLAPLLLIKSSQVYGATKEFMELLFNSPIVDCHIQMLLSCHLFLLVFEVLLCTCIAQFGLVIQGQWPTQLVVFVLLLPKLHVAHVYLKLINDG